ncbi:MAG: hypothetical protein ACODAA_01280 [Gemmatimonadota bacterium]
MLIVPGPGWAQNSGPDGVIDSVHLRVGNVFGDEAADRHWIYRTANSLRFKTRPGVVERELLFAAGDSLDLALLAETERNLRALGLFREVRVDTVVEEDRVVAVVRTRDAWSTLPILHGSFASDGTLTGRVGLTERNVLGTGNFLSLAYRKSTDRDGGEFASRWRRLAGSQVDLAADLALLSDGNLAVWSVSDPFRSLEDRFSLRFEGSTADRRRLRYRTLAPDRRDTTEFRQHLYAGHLSVAVAPIATPEKVLRLRATAAVRNERYLAEPVNGASIPVPDSVFADLGLLASLEYPRYEVVGYVDGLNEQDVDLTSGITVGLRFAPESFGYERTGIGGHFAVRSGTSIGPVLMRAALVANGLFDSAGLDSGRVVTSVTGGVVPGNRHATLFHVEGGLLNSPPPGQEFDLGFSTAPRSFEPHAFVGTRALWGTIEHRWYALPRILDQFGAALAAYFDFGGAWYPDQEPRWGSEIGIGLRTSSRLAPDAESSRIDLGYRLGPGVEGSRFVLSVGTGFTFF